MSAPSPDPIVRHLSTKTLPKTTFDKVLDALILVSAPVFTTSVMTKIMFRGRRI
jgi:hypothetical protein